MVNGLILKVAANAAGVRALVNHLDREAVFVPSAPKIYYYDITSHADDDGDLVLRPDNLTADKAGRWLDLQFTAGEGGGTVYVSDVVGLLDALAEKANQVDLDAQELQAVADSGSTTNAYATLLDMDNSDGYGLYLAGSVKNTGAAVMTIKETVDGPNFEAPESVEHDVASGEYAVLDTLLGAVGDGVPPYSSYKLEVKSKVADTPTDYVLRAQVIGTVN